MTGSPETPPPLPAGYTYLTQFEALLHKTNQWGLEPLGWMYLGTQHALKPNTDLRLRYETHIWARREQHAVSLKAKGSFAYPFYGAAVPTVALALSGPKPVEDREVLEVHPADLTWRLTVYTDTTDLFDPHTGSFMTAFPDGKRPETYLPLLEGCPVYSAAYTGDLEFREALAAAQHIAVDRERLDILTALLRQEPELDENVQ